MNDIEKDVRAEDINPINKAGYPNIWREVADEFGPEVVVFIFRKASGTRIDIGSYKKLLSSALDRNLNTQNPLIKTLL